jgi:HD-GYP domain-containing protein (c-di-GMP phosphodiesterase class II)
MGSLRLIDSSITSGQNINFTLKLVLQQAVNHLRVDAADILLLNPDEEALKYMAGEGFHGRRVEQVNLMRGRGLAWKVVANRKKVLYSLDKDEDTGSIRDFMTSEGFQQYIGLPLLSKGEVKGVLEVFQRSLKGPDIEGLEYLETLAGQAAVAMDNATLIDTLKEKNSEMSFAYDTTIEGWARALELRNIETAGHSQRVVDLTLALAVKMGVRGEELVHMRRGALLHDIGKMGIPDEILDKKGPLTDEEWEVMRRHPRYAFDLLSPIDFLRPALDIPYYHHEKWDGSGYPHGLKGEEIPLAARIFALADVMDALCSDRPYRKKWEEEDAIVYIRQQVGKHFDPRVVEMYEKILERQLALSGKILPGAAK